MVVLAIDYGDARTGIAVCDKLEMLANPVCVIHEKGKKKLINEIIKIACEKEAEKIIVGLPRNMDGSTGFKAESCMEFANSLKNKTSIPVEMWDERLTTVAANTLLNQTSKKGAERKKIIDSAAAVLILQSYIDQKK